MLTTMNDYDVIIVGGGPAGLSAAVSLGRALRRVVVIDHGQPRNAPAGHVHNFLTRDGMPPAELLAIGREEAVSFGAEFVNAKAVGAKKVDDTFTVTLKDGTTLTSRHIVLTVGLIDDLPAIDGLRDRWGKDVLHCPYCHGFEARGQAIGLIAGSPLVMHAVTLWRQWTGNLTVFLNDVYTPTEDELLRMKARNVRIVTGAVEAIETTEDKLSGVRVGGEVITREAVVIQAGAYVRTDLLDDLGITPTDQKMGDVVVGNFIETDARGATVIPGVWAAGNASSVTDQVITSAAKGLFTGAMINAVMAEEETLAAVVALSN